MINSISPHAQQRIKERDVKSTRQIALAMERGLRPEDFTGRFRKYLDSLRIKHKRNLIIYDNNIYAYNLEHELRTVFRVPSRFLKYLRRD